jgi:hypothetical protein
MVALILLPCIANAQISPGPLAQPHHELNGPGECTQCHAISPGSPNFRCLECHRDIAVRVQQRRGLHAQYVAPGSAGAACVRCHSEHNGADFSLVRWNPPIKSFDHSKTGYVLDGKHLGLDCRKCHNREKINPADRAVIVAKDLNRTYLGLSRTCTGCHEDKHKGELGNNCSQCHNSSDWKVAKTFDHSKTKYSLVGAHQDVSCQKCHSTGANGLPRYVGLKFGKCADCHADTHHGAFKQACEECHSLNGWKKVAAAKFDHSTTKYPLEGKHVQVGCEACHHGSDFKRSVGYAACTDCHKPDPHNGQFAKRVDRGACESCHDVNGFKPAKFALAEHNKSAFPLREKHAEVACAKCHIPAGKATLYEVKFAFCLDCHKDIHRGQFARAPYMNRCEQCHNQTTFHKSSVTLASHQKLDFKLTGGHIAVACIDCHKSAPQDGPVRYHFQDLSCTTCHNDPHRGEFAQRMKDASGSGKGGGCTVCHSTKMWKDTVLFDHSSTKFELTGAHRAVTCKACHRPPNMELTLKDVNYSQAPTKCQDCHANVHGRQFARKETGIVACADCHNVTKWRPSTFDHERTVFTLKGAHMDVRCKLCHVNFQDVDGKPVLFYKPTPRTCAACHGGTVKNVTNAGVSSQEDSHEN